MGFLNFLRILDVSMLVPALAGLNLAPRPLSAVPAEFINP
jgi:hypothetical protein